MEKALKKIPERILSDPYLIDKIKSYSGAFATRLISEIPALGIIWDTHQTAQQDIQIKKFEFEIGYIKEKLENIEGRDEDFIKSSEFRNYVQLIIEEITNSSDEYRRRVYANILINGICKNDKVSHKMMYLNTLNNLTATHIRVLGFFIEPETYCKITGNYPADGQRMTGKETVLKEIFINEDFDIIKKAISDLSKEGILKEDSVTLNGQINTIGSYHYPTPNLPPEESPLRKEALQPFKGGLTSYGEKFKKFIIDPY